MPFGRQNKILSQASKLVSNSKQSTLDTGKNFIIVGAGMAGLYSSYRLHQTYPDAKITFFESSDRIGGRLMSVDIGAGSQMEPGGDVYIEKGGMRILTGFQPLVETLLKDLDIGLYNPPPTNANNFDYY